MNEISTLGVPKSLIEEYLKRVESSCQILFMSISDFKNIKKYSKVVKKKDKCFCPEHKMKNCTLSPLNQGSDVEDSLLEDSESNGFDVDDYTDQDTIEQNTEQVNINHDTAHEISITFVSEPLENQSHVPQDAAAENLDPMEGTSSSALSPQEVSSADANEILEVGNTDPTKGIFGSIQQTNSIEDTNEFDDEFSKAIESNVTIKLTTQKIRYELVDSDNVSLSVNTQLKSKLALPKKSFWIKDTNIKEDILYMKRPLKNFLKRLSNKKTVE